MQGLAYRRFNTKNSKQEKRKWDFYLPQDFFSEEVDILDIIKLFTNKHSLHSHEKYYVVYHKPYLQIIEEIDRLKLIGGLK